MSSAVHTFVQPITEPLDGLHGHFSQLATKHRDANNLLRSHANDLLSSGTSDVFTGAGATAFSGLVNYYVDTSEKHARALDDAATTVSTCHTSIMDATYTASSSNLHEGLTHKVLTQVTHNDIIQNGGDAIQAVVNDLMTTLSNMKSTAGDFFGNVFSGNFGAALGDVGQEFSDIGHLASDVTSLLQDIGNVLGQWASTICDAVGKCLKFIGTALWNVVDFVFDFSGIINDVKTLFDPKKSLWDKILAGGDLLLNAGMDISMFFGVGEALRGGELLVKGAVDIGEKILEDGGKQLLKDAVDAGVKLLNDALDHGAQILNDALGGGTLSLAGDGGKLIGQGPVKLFMTATGDGGSQVVKAWIKHDVYHEAVDKIGQEGVDRFVAAMKRGIVRAEGQQGIKRIGLKSAEYELKVLAKKYAMWRFYGNFDKELKMIIFDAFGPHL